MTRHRSACPPAFSRKYLLACWCIGIVMGCSPAGGTSGDGVPGGTENESGGAGTESGGAENENGGTPGIGGQNISGGVGGSSTSSGGSEGTGGASSGGSDILEPASGVLLGLYYGDEDIASTSEKVGRMLPIHLTYYDFTHNWTGTVTQNDLNAGRIPLVNWEVFDTPLDEILAGEHDEMLADRAAQAQALGQRFFIDFGAEMNGEWSPWGGAQNGESAAKYVAAYKYVHDALAAADNLVWLWCPNVTDEPDQEWNETFNYYPGDEYVDWTCVDGYNWGNSGGGGWQTFSEIFQDIYPRLAEKNKPIMIGEMASAEDGGDKAAFIDGIIPTLKSEYPLIKGLVWFDIDKETDWRISSSPEAEAAFQSMAADAYTNP